MSQYQDYFFSDASRDGEYSMLQSPLLNHRNVPGMSFFIDQEFCKENHVTVDPSDVTEIAISTQQNSFKFQNKHVNQKERLKNTIQTSFYSEERRKEIIKGLKDDTTELNTNFKTILSKNLKQASILKEVDLTDIQLIQQFIKTVPSFSGLKLLCKSSAIKAKQLKFIKSPNIIKEIMKSNCSMQNKITMLKYVQCLKENFQLPEIIKWKRQDTL